MAIGKREQPQSHALCFTIDSPYNPNDRVNPEAQLDPKTGKSLSYGKQNGKQHAQ